MKHNSIFKSVQILLIATVGISLAFAGCSIDEKSDYRAKKEGESTQKINFNVHPDCQALCTSADHALSHYKSEKKAEWDVIVNPGHGVFDPSGGYNGSGLPGFIDTWASGGCAAWRNYQNWKDYKKKKKACDTCNAALRGRPSTNNRSAPEPSASLSLTTTVDSPDAVDQFFADFDALVEGGAIDEADVAPGSCPLPSADASPTPVP